jgi:hypothetical protein
MARGSSIIGLVGVPWLGLQRSYSDTSLKHVVYWLGWATPEPWVPPAALWETTRECHREPQNVSFRAAARRLR